MFTIRCKLKKILSGTLSLVDIKQSCSKQRNIPEDSRLQQHLCDHLEAPIINNLPQVYDFKHSSKKQAVIWRILVLSDRTVLNNFSLVADGISTYFRMLLLLREIFCDLLPETLAVVLNPILNNLKVASVV